LSQWLDPISDRTLTKHIGGPEDGTSVMQADARVWIDELGEVRSGFHLPAGDWSRPCRQHKRRVGEHGEPENSGVI